jgi:hypothetical protein
MTQTSSLKFTDTTPLATHGLGGLIRDSFSNGRLSATLGAHGGLLDISYCGSQNLAAFKFFRGDPGTSWTKLFRACVGIGAERHYLPMRDTRLYPFGCTSRAEVAGIGCEQQLLLLPDALVQRFQVMDNPGKHPVCIEMFHQEPMVAVAGANRRWQPFAFEPEANAIITCCTDENPNVYRGAGSIYQSSLGLEVRDAPHAETWIGVGCNLPMTAKFVHAASSGQHFKIYLTSTAATDIAPAFFLVFATGRDELLRRLQELATSVDAECDALLADYESRLKTRPQITVGDPVLDSAFAQFPEVIEHSKIPDWPGATKANNLGYFVWGWDGLTPVISSCLANEPEYAAAILRFFHEARHPRFGIVHQFTTTFDLKLAMVYPAQALYIASLYHYYATTGDLELVREVMPTCTFILDRCRENEIADTGLVTGTGFWPDKPTFLDENGRDLNAVNNALLYQGLRGMESLAALTGDAALAADCRDWARRLRKSFKTYLYDNEKGYFYSSCSADDFSPRKHYPVQAVGYWITPFARELVEHDAARIAAFVNTHLRDRRCMLSVPRWDTAWMLDGNQIGSSFPVADYGCLQVNKLVGDDSALMAWLDDVRYFWQYHTAPEAFTPEALNQDEFGPDNSGGKQTQALSTWYACVYFALAGMEFDHEGIVFRPCGGVALAIRGLCLRGCRLDLQVRGAGSQINALRLNGDARPAGTNKILWSELQGDSAHIELERGENSNGS